MLWSEANTLLRNEVVSSPQAKRANELMAIDTSNQTDAERLAEGEELKAIGKHFVDFYTCLVEQVEDKDNPAFIKEHIAVLKEIQILKEAFDYFNKVFYGVPN